ncbi:methyl-accepting chemotaxis protein [Glaciecola petra]|uniref:Methyl-accepting chemotaxis protein n=1 Tax=Glaciecola petra TaxID=3075602 RepID=A0ABU2ZPZ3_9ALTE|nr:methyl-accepting chemotaxis protein [Aestuariibacter sp. P117]MDT0594689.1 methyl-accepting chemotaxis protein [Aestuariibacter sp. P117]
MSLRSRLLSALLSLPTIAIILMGAALFVSLNNSLSSSLTEEAQSKLSGKLVNVSNSLSSYFTVVENQLLNQANNSRWVKAAIDFENAFNDYATQRGAINTGELSSLESYYKNDFASLYSQRNGEPVSNINTLIEPLNQNSKALQYDFIAGSDYEIGSKDGLSNLNNGSDYARLHNQFHPDARQFLKDFGYYDIFLVEPASGYITYSVFKELDYATSLKSGPYANSGIGIAFKKALANNAKGTISYSELSPYLPSYNAMAGFISTPIYNGEQLVSVLIFQIPLDRVNNIMTHNQDWENNGYGQSGETYLVNGNKKLVTESRFYLEDANSFTESLRSYRPEQTQKVDMAGTTVGLLEVNTLSVQNALNGNSGFESIVDYRGVDVFSAYGEFALGDTSYALLAEIDAQEALLLVSETKSALVWVLIGVGAVVLAVSLVVAFALVLKFTRPLNQVGAMCEDLSTGDADLTIRLEKCGITEIDKLVIAFNGFIEQVHDIFANIRDDSTSLASTSEELMAVTQSTTANATEQRSETSRVNDSISELATSIDNIAVTVSENQTKSQTVNEGLQEHFDNTKLATQKLTNLVDLIKTTGTTISGLRDEVNNVTVFLDDINSIADQTNLLALNAAIEAARAGDAGRGFSVVADEVRALANRSQETTGKISQIIDVMTGASDRSAEVMNNAVSAADEGIDMVSLITEALESVANVLDENARLGAVVAEVTQSQSHTSKTVTGSIENIRRMAHDAETGAEQSSQAATELARIAAHSMEMINRFKV